jgi:hypothetical protein
MYADGLSFLDEEREAWRPFEALLGLSDDQLSAPVPEAHDWSGRDLMGHLLAWMGTWTGIAAELALGPESPAFEALEATDGDWETQGPEINARLQREWSSLPLAEVRRRFASMPGELRGYLTVIPESRWLKNPARLESLLENTTEHYAEHLPDLQAILAAAGR